MVRTNRSRCEHTDANDKPETWTPHVLVSIVMPLVMLVLLTFSVFWMDQEGLSDRINIQFIDILSVVAYYFVVKGSNRGMFAMMKLIEDIVFHRIAARAIPHITLPDLAPNDPLARRVVEQANREFQLVPPLTLHLVDAELLAGAWSAVRESYVVNAQGRALRTWAASTLEQLIDFYVKKSTSLAT